MQPGRPRRRRPYAVVVSTMVTVSMLLLVAWQYAAHRARLEVGANDRTAASADQPATSTPLLSVRRAPGALARSARATRSRAALAPVIDQIGEGSCLSVSSGDGPIVEVGATTPVLPGEALQLITAAVAVDVLGPDAVFTTHVTGALADEADVGEPGVVAGDLFLLGGGDPLLSTAWYAGSGVQRAPPFGTTPLEALADQVVARGVRRVTGGVVGDGSRYDDEWYPPSWHLSVVRSEAGPVDALLVNDGHVDLAAPGTVAEDPAAGAAAAFTQLLRERGVRVDAAPRSGPAIAHDELAAVHSYPLRAVVLEMLHTRDANTAEVLLKEVGLQVQGIGSRDAGLAVVRSRLAAWGVPLDGVSLVDGSGLSNDDRVTCAALAAVLAHARADTAVGAAMPVAGETGALAELAGGPLAGRLVAVSGSRPNLDLVGPGGDPPGVQALAGYVRTGATGQAGALAVVLVLNGGAVTDPLLYRPIWDALVPALASSEEGAPVAELEPR